MATTAPAELVAALEATVASMKRVTPQLNDSLYTYAEILEHHAGTTTMEAREYEKHLKKIHRFRKEEDEQTISLLKNLHQQNAAYKRTVAGHEAAIEKETRYIEEQSVLAKQEIKDKEKYRVAFNNILQAQERLDQAQHKQAKFIEENSSKVEDWTRGIAKHEKELSSFSIKTPMNNILKMMQSGIARMFSGALFVRGVTEIYSTVKSQMATGIELGLKDYYATGFRLGLQPEEYVKLVAANRQAVLAAGGMAENLEILQAGQTRYWGFIGDLGETTKFTQEQMTMLTRSGIRPALADVNLLGKSFESLRKTAGMTGADFNTALSGIVEDEASIARLRAVSTDDERRAIIQGTARRLAENVAMGMTIEQATAAAKTLNKLAGQGPLDRFKQAAKLRAFGGAMGVGGTEEAARILIKGRRATDAELQQLQGVLSQMSNRLELTATQSPGTEMFATQLAEKLGMGPMLEINTTLAKSVAPSRKSLETLGEIDKKLKWGFEMLQKSIGALTSPVAKIGAGGIGGLLSLAGGTTSLGGGLLSLFTGGAGVGAGGTTAGVVTAGASGATLTAAAIAGAQVIAVGAAAYGGTRLVDKLVEKATGQGFSERLSRRFVSDAERRLSIEWAKPSGTVTDPSSARTVQGITDQVNKMTETNTYLKQLNETAEKQVGLAEKTLTAIVLTEDMKKSAAFRNKLLQGNQYAYLANA